MCIRDSLDGGGGVFDEKNAVFCLRSRLVFFQLTILIQLKGRIRCDRVSIRRYCLAQDIGGVGLQLFYYLCLLYTSRCV